MIVMEGKGGDPYIYDEKEYCSEYWDINTNPELQWRDGDKMMGK